MKLLAELNNEKHEIEINFEGENIFARIDGKEYRIESSEVEPDVYLFKYNHQIHQIYVAPNGLVNIGNQQLEIKVIDPKRLRGSTGSEAETEGIAEIKTAMPGRIVRILVAEGDEVIHGQGIIVVEAMKMQNEMKSPKDGVVKSIKVENGVNVQAGEVLVIIE